MPWLQLHVLSSRADAESVEAALLSAGALSVTMTDEADTPILEPGLGETPLWDRVRVTGLFEEGADREAVAKQLCEHSGATPPDIAWEALADQPWERAWMDHFEPLRCGSRLWICPSWREPPDPEGINLLLDPGLAFGTGTHPTTYLCLQWLDGLVLRGTTVVDYGCGSGILGIAALLLGADAVIAVDNDPQALLATRENLHRNGLADNLLTTCLPEELPDTAAAVVVANILAEPLVALAGRIAGLTAPGGQLCLSGIMAHQEDQVRAAYPGFRFSATTRRDEWTRLNAVKLGPDHTT